MSRIRHLATQPITLQFWDYYILCRLDAQAALALQRLEYWDGTKDDEAADGSPGESQQRCRWIYKSQEELHWELMGLLGEKQMGRVLTFLVEVLHYLARRNNPYHGFDRKKQYAVQVVTIQRHLDHLGAIIGAFALPLVRLKPIFYTIEQLTREGVTIEALDIDQVLARMVQLEVDPATPFFLRVELKRLQQLPGWPQTRPFCESAPWIGQQSSMNGTHLPYGSGEYAESITQSGASNSRESCKEDKQEETSKEQGGVLPHAFALDAEIQTVIDDWNSLHAKPAPLTEEFVHAASLLAPCHLSRDELASIERFCYQSNPDWFQRRGVKLHNIVTHLEKWQSWQAQQPGKENVADAPTNGTVSGRRRLGVPPPSLPERGGEEHGDTTPTQY